MGSDLPQGGSPAAARTGTPTIVIAGASPVDTVPPPGYLRPRSLDSPRAGQTQTPIPTPTPTPTPSQTQPSSRSPRASPRASSHGPSTPTRLFSPHRRSHLASSPRSRPRSLSPKRGSGSGSRGHSPLNPNPSGHSPASSPLAAESAMLRPLAAAAAGVAAAVGGVPAADTWDRPASRSNTPDPAAEADAHLIEAMTGSPPSRSTTPPSDEGTPAEGRDDRGRTRERPVRRRKKRGTFSIGTDAPEPEEMEMTRWDAKGTGNGIAAARPGDRDHGDSNGSSQPSPHVAFDSDGSRTEYAFPPGEGAGHKEHGGASGSEGVEKERGEALDGDGGSSGKDDKTPEAPPKTNGRLHKLLHTVLSNRRVAWIKPRLTWDDIKPVIRIAVSTWIGFLFVLIKETGDFLGLAAFLVLIVACMVPPFQPFVQVLEILLNTIWYTSLSWGWCCIATAIAHAVRKPTDPQVIADALAKHPGATGMLQELWLLTEAVYLQAAPAIVCCVFLSVGTGALLWWKMRTVPSPATFPLVLSCILINITLTTTPLYGRAYYMSPFTVWKPIVIQSGIGLLCSAVILPESVTSQFRRRFAVVLRPLEKGMTEIEALFTEGHDMDTFGVAGAEADTHSQRYVTFDDPNSEREAKVTAWGDRSAQIRTTLTGSLAGMQPLQAQVRYLPVDISYGRLSGQDVYELFDILASVQVRASGLSYFFNTIVNKLRHTHLDSKAFNAHETATHSLSRVHSRTDTSRAGSRSGSRPGSRVPSRQASARDLRDSEGPATDLDFSALDSPKHSTPDDGHRSIHDTENSHEQGAHDPDHELSLASHLRLALQRGHIKHGSHASLSHLGHSRKGSKGSGSGLHLHKSSHTQLHSAKGSTISLIDHLRKTQQPVGVYESQRYMDLERGDERDLERLVKQLELLSTGALPLVTALRKALAVAIAWTKTSDRKRHAQLRDIQTSHGHLCVMLAEFREHRTEVTKPYSHLFDPGQAHTLAPPAHETTLPHVGLYYCFVAQYHLMEFSDAMVKFLAKMIELDTQRQTRRLWYPASFLALFGQFGESVKQNTEDGTAEEAAPDADHNDEVDEDGLGSEADSEETAGLLGEARRRNPDYRPWSSTTMVLLSKLSKIPDILSSRSAMFALKAGILSCFTTLPAYFSTSASFYYNNRGVWVTIMAQMTLAVFSGDTFSSWMKRLQASFWGTLCGLAVWYIGAGHGKGNPFGLGVITAVTFPAIMFYRLYYTGGLLTTVVFATTIMLVVGYSWQNANILQASSASWGWDVAWRRFVCVVIGITAAWVWSVVPPAYSAKKAIRVSYSGSIMTSGRILCQILSMANDPHYHPTHAQYRKTRKDLLKARTKLSKMGVRHVNAVNEMSLRGRWPQARYEALLNTLVETMSLLSQLNHLLPQMDIRWRRALLARTRMADPLFLGDVLAVISMTSAALRTAAPLPQITPGPLVAKYHMNKHKGLEVPADPHHHDDLPAHVTVEVLESDDYMRYALGVTTVYALMARLDSIVVVCKTLLGEHFHIGHLRVDDLHVSDNA